MGIKIHYLFIHCDCFPENLRDVSEEQSEKFHQNGEKIFRLIGHSLNV